MIRSGAFMRWVILHPITTKVKILIQFFTITPFDMNPTAINAWYYYGGDLELLNEVYARHNIVVFPAGNIHLQMDEWCRKEIHSIHDLKGLKMRIPGHAGEVVSRIGMKPVSISFR